jgi:bifunctional non-homologous end joining protein LigD
MKSDIDFISPMECLSVSKLPDGPNWVWEIKLDGYRAIGVKSEGKVSLWSRNRKSLSRQFPLIAEALTGLPDGTVVDGEIVAMGDDGRPNFNLLQNFKSEAKRIRLFVFDLLCYQGRDLTKLGLMRRRELLGKLAFNNRVVRLDYLEAAPQELLAAVRAQGLEGVIGKRKDSLYESGKRSGAWVKCRLNTGQEFVIGGYIPGGHGVDSIIVGFYREKELIYVARVRNGFVPATRRMVRDKLKPLVRPDCPFANLPETHKGRWGEGLTADEMRKCVWVQPKLVAQIEFLEWTGTNHLRHSKFAGLREDKDARSVVKEHGGEKT